MPTVFRRKILRNYVLGNREAILDHDESQLIEVT